MTDVTRDYLKYTDTGLSEKFVEMQSKLWSEALRSFENVRLETEWN